MIGRDERPRDLASELAAAGAELAGFFAAFQKADTELAHAKNIATDALNRVNQAQKKIDAIVAEMKRTAPRDSDWRRPPPRMVEVPPEFLPKAAD